MLCQGYPFLGLRNVTESGKETDMAAEEESPGVGTGGTRKYSHNWMRAPSCCRVWHGPGLVSRLWILPGWSIPLQCNALNEEKYAKKPTVVTSQGFKDLELNGDGFWLQAMFDEDRCTPHITWGNAPVERPCQTVQRREVASVCVLLWTDPL